MTEQATTELVPEWDMSDRLRKALTHAGISSNEMAEYLEVTRHTISNWINGRTRPPATAVKLWAMRTGVPYEWIAHGIVPRSVPQRSHYGSERPSTAELSTVTGGLRKRIAPTDDELAARLSSGIPVGAVLTRGQV